MEIEKTLDFFWLTAVAKKGSGRQFGINLPVMMVYCCLLLTLCVWGPFRSARHTIFGNSSALAILLFCPERSERGGPCRLLKLRQMGTYGVHRKGVLSWLVFDFLLDSLCRYKIYLSCLGCYSQPNTKNSPHSFSLFVSPSPRNLGRAGSRPGRLSLNMCLWFCHPEFRINVLP